MISTDRGKWTIATTLFFLVITGTGGGIAEATEPSPDLYTALERFHGHTCGGSIMGVRLGLAARAALEQAGMPGKLKAQYFSRSCSVDGIQVAAGTTYGNQAIEAQDGDDHRLILIDEKSGRTVEARLTEKALQKAKASREAAQKARALPAGSTERKQLDREVEGIFAWLRTAPEADVVIVKFVR